MNSVQPSLSEVVVIEREEVYGRAVDVQGGFYCIWNPREVGVINCNKEYEGSYFEFRNVQECTNYVVRLCFRYHSWCHIIQPYPTGVPAEATNRAEFGCSCGCLIVANQFENKIARIISTFV